MQLSEIKISHDCTHHLRAGLPLYPSRFLRVEKFHPPGLAPVIDASGAYHITLTGEPAYLQRFRRTAGFYEGLAAIEDTTGWCHIHPDGSALYTTRYSWCGNFQEGLVVVRDHNNRYSYLNHYGQPVHRTFYLYAGDFHDGVACVRRDDGWCMHVDPRGEFIHPCKYLDLDVFHKGFARARDEGGWFHISYDGKPAYQRRFLDVEPFYNGQAYCLTHAGERVVISEAGDIVVLIWRSLQNTGQTINSQNHEKQSDV